MQDNISETERLMYDILGRICTTDVPIVFKGALITKIVLFEHGFTTTNRETIDIDANWVGRIPPMEEIVKIINDALNLQDNKYRAEFFRDYREGIQTGGVLIYDSNTNSQLVTMDIDIRPIIGSRTYYYGEIAIRGVDPKEIIADKISVISSRMIFRRAKDLIDVFALSQCINVTTDEIYEITQSKNRELGVFDEFRNRKSDLEHAYSRLRRVSNKPQFMEIYSYLESFLFPFISGDRSHREWNCDELRWT